MYITVVLCMSTETTVGNFGASRNEPDKVKAKKPKLEWNELPTLKARNTTRYINGGGPI